MIPDGQLPKMRSESGASCNRRRAVESGMVFGMWTVIGENPHKRRGKVLCRCKCGTEKEVYVENLRSGRSQSCKCRIVEPFMVINRLQVMGYPFIQPDQSRRLVVRCRCEICQKIVYPSVRDLLGGKHKACGCYRENLDYRARCECAKGAGDPVYNAPPAYPYKADSDEGVYWLSKITPFSKSQVRKHKMLKW